MTRRVLVLGGLSLGVIAAVVLVLRHGQDPIGLATGTGGLEGAPPSPIMFPAPGAIDVPNSWDGNEVPQPAQPPAGYPSGPLVTLQMGSLPVTVIDAVITDDPKGTPLGAAIFTADNDGKLPLGVVALLPHKPLKPLSLHQVTILGTYEGESFHRSWSFTTRRDGCDLLGQDCGDGKACYLMNAGVSCQWAGGGRLDDVCTYTNECSMGLACYGARCRPFCDPSETADKTLSCTTHCPLGSIPQPGPVIDQPATICLGASCAQDASRCRDDESCYWLGPGAFACTTSGDGGDGTSCKAPNDCAAGLSCLGVDGVQACHVLCGGAGMPACEEACKGNHLLLDENLGVRFCL